MRAFRFQISAKIRLGITFPERRETDETLLLFSLYGDLFAALDFISGLLKILNKLFKAVRTCALKNCIDIPADLIAQVLPFRIFCSFLAVAIRLRFDDGQAMLETDQITDSLQRNTRQPEVFEFAGCIQRCGIE